MKRLCLTMFFVLLTLSIGLVTVNFPLTVKAQNNALSQNGSDNEAEQETGQAQLADQGGQCVSSVQTVGSCNNLDLSSSCNSDSCSSTDVDPARALLTVKVLVGCESTGGNPSDESVCTFVTQNALPRDFQLEITANNPDHATFPGSTKGERVNLDAGPYFIRESFSKLDLIAGFLNPSSISINVEASGDCYSQSEFADAQGLILPAQEQTCILTNTFVVEGGTGPSISG